MCELVRRRFNCKAQISGLNKVEIYLCLPKKSRDRLSRTGLVVPWSSQIPASSVFHPEDRLTVQDGCWRFSHYVHVSNKKKPGEGLEKHKG